MFPITVSLTNTGNYLKITNVSGIWYIKRCKLYFMYIFHYSPLRVREDQVTEGNCREDILKNASVTEEDYFVAPPGNIPLGGKDHSLQDADIKTKIKSKIQS